MNRRTKRTLIVAGLLVGAAAMGLGIWLVNDWVAVRQVQQECRKAYWRCRAFCEEVAQGKQYDDRPSDAGPCEWPLSERGQAMRALPVDRSDAMWFYACAAQCGIEAALCIDFPAPCVPGSFHGTR